MLNKSGNPYGSINENQVALILEQKISQHDLHNVRVNQIQLLSDIMDNFIVRLKCIITSGVVEKVVYVDREVKVPVVMEPQPIEEYKTIFELWGLRLQKRA